MNSLKVFIFAGSLSTNLIHSKISPIMNSDYVAQVYIFGRFLDYKNNKCVCISTPRKINKLRPILLRRIFRPLVEFIQIGYYCMKIKPDLINGIYTVPYGLYSLILSRAFKIKNMVSIIGNEEELYKIGHKFQNLKKKINYFIYYHSDVITTKGNKTSKFLIDFGIQKKKIITFNGSIDTFRFKNEDLDREIEILFVGRFSELKGPDRVIKIIKNVKDKGLNIRAVFLGDGELLPKVLNLIDTMNLQNNIKIEKYKNNVEDFLKRSKILVMPSRMEGLSTAMLEAMSCGCVPIVSDVGNMTEAAFHNYNSLVVKDYMDIKKYAEFAYELLCNESKWERLSLNAVRTVREKYSIEKQTEIFDKILFQLMG